MTNQFKYTPRDADTALRSNMDRCLIHAANGQSRVGLTRREIIKQVMESRPEVAKYRPRIANVKRLPSVNGFHVVGLGTLPQVTMGELRKVLRCGTSNFRGCTGFRIGGFQYKV